MQRHPVGPCVPVGGSCRAHGDGGLLGLKMGDLLESVLLEEATFYWECSVCLEQMSVT